MLRKQYTLLLTRIMAYLNASFSAKATDCLNRDYRPSRSTMSELFFSG